MASDKKVDTIQEEIKLLKGELKNSLASVRDYLLNMELPSSEFSTILAALGDSGEQRITMRGSFTAPQEGQPVAEPHDEVVETTREESTDDESEIPSEDDDLISVDDSAEDESETTSEESTVDDTQHTAPEESISEQELIPEESTSDEELIPEESISDEEFMPEESELPQDEIPEEELNTLEEADEHADNTLTPVPDVSLEEEQFMDYDKNTEVNPPTPKINMLANLINWVAKAKKEIGCEQLPTFLEVYGVSGHLSPELKEVIIHLSELTSEQPEIVNNAELWTQAMLSLHGILTGGDAPRHPIIPSWADVSSEIEEEGEEEIIEVDKSKEKPVKLKLVFPDKDGNDKEFCIDLNPETVNNVSLEKSGK